MVPGRCCHQPVAGVLPAVCAAAVFQFHFVEVFRAVATKVREATSAISSWLPSRLSCSSVSSQFCRRAAQDSICPSRPSGSHRTVRRNHFAIGIKGDSFPFRLFSWPSASTRSAARSIRPARSNRRVLPASPASACRCSDAIVGEILAWVVEVEFTQHYVAIASAIAASVPCFGASHRSHVWRFQRSLV